MYVHLRSQYERWRESFEVAEYGISQLTSHQWSRALADCFRDIIKICGQLWLQEQPYLKFWASFPKIYRFQQAKPILKLTIQIGLAGWNRKISENLANEFHVKLFCRKSCQHLGRWLNTNVNGQFVIAMWRIQCKYCGQRYDKIQSCAYALFILLVYLCKMHISTSGLIQLTMGQFRVSKFEVVSRMK